MSAFELIESLLVEVSHFFGEAIKDKNAIYLLVSEWDPNSWPEYLHKAPIKEFI